MTDHELAGSPLPSRAPLPANSAPRIPVLALGLSLSVFLSLTYGLCVMFDVLFPAHAMYPVWSPLLPGFEWLTISGFFIGLGEAFGYGWYIALLFGPLYNFFVSRDGRQRSA